MLERLRALLDRLREWWSIAVPIAEAEIEEARERWKRENLDDGWRRRGER